MWGFSGHLNVKLIIEQLQRTGHGFAAATSVLVGGGSAGGMGAFVNVDYIQEQAPRATVKAAPNPGWLFPGDPAL